MSSILFLTKEEVLNAHTYLIQEYGGSTGVRDKQLLESALAAPQMGIGGKFLHGSIYEMAAAYAYHIIKNHAFIDGNKRTGSLAMLLFLRKNGIHIGWSKTKLIVTAIKIANSKMTKAELAQKIEGSITNQR